MMNVAILPSCASALRVQRLALWLALSVARFAAAFIGRLAPRTARDLLDRYTRATMAILFLMAWRGMALRKRSSGFVPVQRRAATMRDIAGGELRRYLRTGSLRQRALAITSVLAAPARWISHIARRMRRGFTKLTPKPAPRALLVFEAETATSSSRPINSS